MDKYGYKLTILVNGKPDWDMGGPAGNDVNQVAKTISDISESIRRTGKIGCGNRLGQISDARGWI